MNEKDKNLLREFLGWYHGNHVEEGEIEETILDFIAECEEEEE